MDTQEYDNLPQYVKNIIDTFDDNKELYKECKRIQRQLNSVGWDCEYELSGDIFDVKMLPYNHESKVNNLMQKIVYHLPNKQDVSFNGDMSFFVNNGNLSLRIGDDMYYAENIYDGFHYKYLTKLYDLLLKEIAKLEWEKLGDIPVNDDEEIDNKFSLMNGIEFDKGTDVTEIWHYFEETYNISVFNDLM